MSEEDGIPNACDTSSLNGVLSAFCSIFSAQAKSAGLLPSPSPSSIPPPGPPPATAPVSSAASPSSFSPPPLTPSPLPSSSFTPTPTSTAPVPPSTASSIGTTNSQVSEGFTAVESNSSTTDSSTLSTSGIPSVSLSAASTTDKPEESLSSTIFSSPPQSKQTLEQQGNHKTQFVTPLVGGILGGLLLITVVLGLLVWFRKFRKSPSISRTNSIESFGNILERERANGGFVTKSINGARSVLSPTFVRRAESRNDHRGASPVMFGSIEASSTAALYDLSTRISLERALRNDNESMISDSSTLFSQPHSLPQRPVSGNIDSRYLTGIRAAAEARNSYYPNALAGQSRSTQDIPEVPESVESDSMCEG